MHPGPDFYCDVSLFTGSLSQLLIQEYSMSASKGETVTLSCAGNSNNVGAYYVGWYQQILGSAPKTVMLGTSRPTGIPGRFSGSYSGNTATLTITGLQVEDEANYYCNGYDPFCTNNPFSLGPVEIIREI
uniref:Ig-like domain-containing protein n=1 Tax=Marmota marmota marmota TaxID=9994 RepID=A0A8C5ZUC4_MARMA